MSRATNSEDPESITPDPGCKEEEHDPTNVECICFRPPAWFRKSR